MEGLTRVLAEEAIHLQAALVDLEVEGLEADSEGGSTRATSILKIYSVLSQEGDRDGGVDHHRTRIRSWSAKTLKFRQTSRLWTRRRV